ncbi:hypothetical protein IA817_04370 [Listeria seeligeri]|nr:hypothetical protein [Listeria seeligeri]MBF2480550.1 hypothetical protein [Listeria seeligeri]
MRGRVGVEIKYDDLELMELFYSEGQSLTGNIEDGDILYRRSNENFKLTMFIYNYEQRINIFLQYKEMDMISIELKDVSSLQKADHYLKIYRNDQEVGNICFGENFLISIED